MSKQHIHFVTGRLAERALRRIVEELSASAGFEYSIEVLPITVAALMTPEWIGKRWSVPEVATSVLIPGYCHGDLHDLAMMTGRTVERGPRDLHQLPAHFSQPARSDDYGAWDISILAEINHCPQLPLEVILAEATRLANDGADIIDVGCEPGQPWTGVGDAVRALRDAGLRVSIDSMNAQEIEAAVAEGAELVLSVNSSNREAALDWGVEVVAIPDDPATLAGLDETADLLARHRVPLRIDPILEPIGCGFAESLGRYLAVRDRYPDAEIMMGIGNLTELTDVDSAGVNVLLLGVCQELSIRSVLTTQVINWARTSVKECDLARRLAYHAINQGVPPKHLEPRLVMLRDVRVDELPVDEIAALAQNIRDRNLRIFVSEGAVHVVTRQIHLRGEDPFALFEQLQSALDQQQTSRTTASLDPSHAFYLGYEMCKAAIALTLGKSYEQDQALDWGLATRPEQWRYLRRRGAVGGARADCADGDATTE